MIDKELDPFDKSNASPIDIAGRLAEEQMAYYLKRRFLTDSRARVINDLRLDVGGIVIQIDHLMLSPYGIQAVESKSVTTEVAINSRGEWSRFFNGQWKGMASPVEQVTEQLRLLRSFLIANAPALLGKVLGLQKNFGGFEYLGYVAISNSGLVDRPSNNEFKEVLKADQVCKVLFDNLEDWRKRSGIRSLLVSDSVPWISMPELDSVVDYLLSKHLPREELESSPQPQTDSSVLVMPSDSLPTVAAKQNLAQDRLSSSRYFCATCKRSVGLAVAQYCWGNRNRFSGRVYCMEHQKTY